MMTRIQNYLGASMEIVEFFFSPLHFQLFFCYNIFPFLCSLRLKIAWCMKKEGIKLQAQINNQALFFHSANLIQGLMTTVWRVAWLLFQVTGASGGIKDIQLTERYGLEVIYLVDLCRASKKKSLQQIFR